MSRAPRNRRDELLQRLTEAARELSDAMILFHSALAGRLGLGTSDWKTLGLLDRFGPMTAGELSALSGLAPPSVTGLLDRLERGGWVRRRRDPADGRRILVELDRTAVDRRLGDAFAGLMRRLDELYDSYSDDQLEFLAGALKEMARRQGEATAELQQRPDGQAR